MPKVGANAVGICAIAHYGGNALLVARPGMFRPAKCNIPDGRAAMSRRSWDGVIKALVDLKTMTPVPPRHRILDLNQKGFSPSVIAWLVECTRMTVHRVLEEGAGETVPPLPAIYHALLDTSIPCRPLAVAPALDSAKRASTRKSKARKRGHRPDWHGWVYGGSPIPHYGGGYVD